MKRCFLCEMKTKSFIKSHIVSRGFFSHCQTQCSMAMIDAEGNFKRRPNALYLTDCICNDCEKNIFTPLDEYALTIFRDKKASELTNYEDGQMLTFRNINRRLLRAYLASLLWRFNLGRETGIDECRNVDIEEFKETIRCDLLDYKNRDFDYIDAFVYLLTSITHQSFRAPQKMKREFMNGFYIEFPFLSMYISLGYEKNPLVNRELPLSLSGTALSLAREYDDKSYLIFQRDYDEYRASSLFDCILDYNRIGLRKVKVD